MIDLKQIQQIYNGLMKFSKTTLIVIILLLPLGCYVSVSYYLKEKTKSDSLIKLFNEQRVISQSIDSIKSIQTNILLKINELDNSIEDKLLSNNKYIISEVGKQMKFQLQWSNQKTELLLNQVDNWVETVNNQIETHREYNIKVIKK